jgi:hypothetical protein
VRPCGSPSLPPARRRLRGAPSGMNLHLLGVIDLAIVRVGQEL